jgi:hypothetical protein
MRSNERLEVNVGHCATQGTLELLHSASTISRDVGGGFTGIAGLTHGDSQLPQSATCPLARSDRNRHITILRQASFPCDPIASTHKVTKGVFHLSCP